MRKAFKIPLIILGAFIGLIIVAAAIGGSDDESTNMQESKTGDKTVPGTGNELMQEPQPKPATFTGDIRNLLPNPEDIPGIWQMGEDDEKYSYARERIPNDTWTQQALGEIDEVDTFAKADYKRMPTKNKDRTYVTLELTKFSSSEKAYDALQDLKYYNEPNSEYFDIVEDFGVCYQLSYSIPKSFSNSGIVLCSYENILISSYTADGDWYSDTTALWEVTSPVLDDLADAVGVPKDWKQAIPKMERGLESRLIGYDVNPEFLDRLKSKN